MGVFSVPVTIGVDEEAIANSIKQNVEAQVVRNITDEVKKVIYGTTYYGRIDEKDLEPLRNMVKAQVQTIIRDRDDEIVKLAAEILADKLSRSKAVKEAAAEVAKKVE